MDRKPDSYWTEGKGKKRKVHPIFEPTGHRIAHSKFAEPSRDDIYESHMQHAIEYRGGKDRRRGWILTRWEWQHSGDVDMAKRAQHGHIPPYPETSQYRWEATGRKAKADLVGLDHPRKDITSFKGKGSKRVYVGGTHPKTRAMLKAKTQQVLRTNFTKEEIDAMGSIYMDGSRPTSRHAAATCSSVRTSRRVRGTPYETPSRNHMITVKTDHLYNEEVITHELVHARRHGMGEWTRDRDEEEKMTDLETIARVRDPPEWYGGYYQYVPPDEQSRREAEHHRDFLVRCKKTDRIALTGSMKKNIKGKRAVQKVRDYLPQSKIAKARFSPAERLDRFFIIQKGRMRIDHHMRFDKPPARNHVVKDLKADFGEDIKVWEWKDGKKVRVF